MDVFEDDDADFAAASATLADGGDRNFGVSRKACGEVVALRLCQNIPHLSQYDVIPQPNN
jgi:hypothetical protein